MRWLAGLLAVLIVLVSIVGQTYVYLSERSSREELARVGAIQFGQLQLDVAADRFLPHSVVEENAAPHYLTALNSYNARRKPPKSRTAAFIEEPRISDAELQAIVLGSRCAYCDFYAGADGPAPSMLGFQQSNGKLWAFAPATNPFDVRPYVPAMRMLAEVALREGKRNERKRSWKWAEGVYLAVMRMAWHLRQNPGSLMDLQLGLEIERKAAHYLDVFYMRTHNRERRLLCWQYGDSLNRLVAAVQHKYAQLGTFEAAREIALHDTDPMWRVEAIAALKTAADNPGSNWWRRRRATALFEELRRLPDGRIAHAAAHALALKDDLGPEERHEPLGSKHREPETD